MWPAGRCSGGKPMTAATFWVEDLPHWPVFLAPNYKWIFTSKNRPKAYEIGIR